METNIRGRLSALWHLPYFSYTLTTKDRTMTLEVNKRWDATIYNLTCGVDVVARAKGANFTTLDALCKKAGFPVPIGGMDWVPNEIRPGRGGYNWGK